MWIDMDAMIQNMAFQIPFDKYDGKDFVAWGTDELIQGDAQGGAAQSNYSITHCLKCCLSAATFCTR